MKSERRLAVDSLVNENTFTCWHCQRTLPYVRKDVGGVTQTIGLVSSSRGPHCYDCHTRFEVEKMIQDGSAILYLTLAPKWSGCGNVPPLDWPRSTITNYSGTFELKLPGTPDKSKHNWGCDRYDVWFYGPDGALWHGLNIGDNQILRCKRLKKQKKNLRPLNEAAYIKPFDYNKLSR